MPRTHFWHGFTLLELLLVMAIVVLLLLFSLPNYREMMAKRHRVEAQTALMNNALWLSRFYAQNGSYLLDRSGRAVQLPQPQILDGDEVLYAIRVDAVPGNAQSYRLIARPQGALRTDRCGSYWLSQDGARGNQANSDTAGFNPVNCGA